VFCCLPSKDASVLATCQCFFVQVVPGVLKDRGASIFRVWTAWAWRWRHHVPRNTDRRHTCRTLASTPLCLTTWLPPSDRPPLEPTIAVRHPRGRSVQGPARTGTQGRRKRGCPCPPPDDTGTTQHRWSSEPWRSSTLSLRAWCGPSPACGSCPRSRKRGALQSKASKMLQTVGFTRSSEISVSLIRNVFNVLVRHSYEHKTGNVCVT